MTFDWGVRYENGEEGQGTPGTPCGYEGDWCPGEYAIYSDFGLRSLYILEILPWPEGMPDRFTSRPTVIRGLVLPGVTSDRGRGSVRALVLDVSLVDWDMIELPFEKQRTLDKLGTDRYYRYSNLYRNIEELEVHVARTLYPHVLARLQMDIRAEPGWLALEYYGLTS